MAPKHGLLFLALTDEKGNLIWISPAHRGAASEIRAARQDRIAARLRIAGPGALADLGFTGLDPNPHDPVIITGRKSTRTSKTTPAQRQAMAGNRNASRQGWSYLLFFGFSARTSLLYSCLFAQFLEHFHKKMRDFRSMLATPLIATFDPRAVPFGDI